MSVEATRPTLESYAAEEVRVILARRRRSAHWLAQRLGWSKSQLSRKLTNQASITVDDLGRLAAALGVGLGDLLPKAEDVNLVERLYGLIVTLAKYLSLTSRAYA